jgi:serine/threonine protein kinase/Flp pilus assembly protein TadD
MAASPLSSSSEVPCWADAFAAALERDPAADLAAFLPPRDHVLYLATLGELVRADLAHAWAAERPRRLPEYLSRFPVLLECRALLAAVAREEYRLRRAAGEDATPDEYAAKFRLDTSGWEQPDPDEPPRTMLVATAVVSAAPPIVNTGVALARPPASVDLEDWEDVAEALPQVGTTFLGFRLVEELGHGAFGRVYLAEQDELSARPVALKVACDIAGESRTLAQLQHTNIVPIYSFHRAGPFQAVCMPYFGRTTLADVVRLIGGRRSLPNSGRELRSTVNQHSATVPVDTVRLRPAAAALPKTQITGAAPQPTEPEPPFPEPEPPPAPAKAAAPAGGDPDGWARLEGLSYVGAVLCLGEQLAAGLAHAHARGILHRDLKPANVLLADEGRPMLLDFNLAEDTKLRNPAGRVAMGGTLPYMAPEQLQAFFVGDGEADERCDIFSLGVILFELLTGRHPYSLMRGSAVEAVPKAIEERQKAPPSVRERNPSVSPATEAIVHKCLAGDPAARYQTAEQLREDLDRQLNHLPLLHAPNPSRAERARKWVRRHPRLASSGTVAVVAALLLAGLGAGAAVAREREKNLHARTQLADHRADLDGVRLFLDDRNQSRSRPDDSLEKLRAVLARYGVPEDGTDDGWLSAPDVARLSDTDRAKLRADVGEVFYRMAQVSLAESLRGDAVEWLGRAGRWNAAAGHYAGDRIPRALADQRAAIAEGRGDYAARDRLKAEAEQITAESPRDLLLLGTGLTQRGKHREALPHLRRSTQLDPRDFSAWFVRGTVHLALEQYELAAMSFGACLAIRDDFAPAWLNRGVAFSQLRFFDQAIDDFDRAAKLDPSLPAVYIERAAARYLNGDPKGAVADYGRALAGENPPVRVYFLRATVRDELGDKDGAKADREKGLSLTPADELSWIGRGETRYHHGNDPGGALADADAALRLNPASVPALQLKAQVLAEKLKEPEEAVRVLSRAVELNPDYVPARAGRGVVLARGGKRAEALADAEEALKRDTRAPNLYQVACIHALLAKDHPENRDRAYELLWRSLRSGFGLDWVDTDPDLDPLRADPKFKDLVAGARRFYEASKR